MVTGVTEQNQKAPLALEDEAFIEELFKVGAYIGRSKSRCHPSMAKYIFATRHNTNLIDLQATLTKLKEAAAKMKEALAREGLILFVGTNPAVRDLVERFAKDLNQPFVAERWLGGTLTNFKSILKRVEYLEELIVQRQGGQLEKYTKKEQLNLERQLNDMEGKFGGLRLLKKLPEVLFVANLNRHEDAVKEARKAGVKIIGIIDTDADATLIDYPIPANDSSRSVIELLLSKLASIIKAS